MEDNQFIADNYEGGDNEYGLGEDMERAERDLLEEELQGQLQYEANIRANHEEEAIIPRRLEYGFGGDDIAMVEADENHLPVLDIAHENEEDQDAMVGYQGVQEIEDGVRLVQDAIRRMDHGVLNGPDAQQRLHGYLNVLHFLALAIRGIHINFALIRPRIERPHIPAIRFDLNQIPDANCQLYFRFTADEIQQIVVALRMPGIVILDNGSKVHCVEAFCITLRRLTYPCRLFDLMDIFGRSQCMISRIFNHTLRILYQRWRPRLLWDSARLNREKLEEFHSAIRRQGAPCRTTFGFIDGTVRAVCRPIENQEMIYNGHKRIHAMKYQSVATPDGIIVHLSGPFAGNRHDLRLYEISGITQTLRTDAKGYNDRQMTLYGDPAYTLSNVMQRPFPTQGISPEERRFNERMSKVSVAVEWCFGYVLQYFPFSDFKKSQKTLLAEVHTHYICSVLLANIHSCIRQTNPSASKFRVNPPTIDEYLHD